MVSKKEIEVQIIPQYVTSGIRDIAEKEANASIPMEQKTVKNTFKLEGAVSQGANRDTGQTANTGQGEVAPKEMNANFCTDSLFTTVLEAEAGVKATGAEAVVTPAAVVAVAKIPAEEETTGKNQFFVSMTTLAALQLFCTL